MTGFGEQLRMERERRGLPIEALCSTTKVQQRHLEALEEEDYSALPGGVIRRGIVRAYLAATGLAEDEWMPRFQHSYDCQAGTLGAGAEREGEAWAAFAENVRKNRSDAGGSESVRWMGVSMMLLALMVGAWAVWHFLLQMRGHR